MKLHSMNLFQNVDVFKPRKRSLAFWAVAYKRFDRISNTRNFSADTQAPGRRFTHHSRQDFLKTLYKVLGHHIQQSVEGLM